LEHSNLVKLYYSGLEPLIHTLSVGFSISYEIHAGFDERKPILM